MKETELIEKLYDQAEREALRPGGMTPEESAAHIKTIYTLMRIQAQSMEQVAKLVSQINRRIAVKTSTIIMPPGRG